MRDFSMVVLSRQFLTSHLSTIRSEINVSKYFKLTPACVISHCPFFASTSPLQYRLSFPLFSAHHVFFFCYVLLAQVSRSKKGSLTSRNFLLSLRDPEQHPPLDPSNPDNHPSPPLSTHSSGRRSGEFFAAISPLLNIVCRRSLQTMTFHYRVVKMLPWESLPRLRRQEVYRMPSIGSIFLTLARNYQRHKEKEREELLSGRSYFPEVDPFDTYYLLNPSGDLKDRRQLEAVGMTGVAQMREELGLVLRNHDMLFYFGHDSGTQYILRREIEKLEIRAVALLMGCSSGMLECQGSYAPQGTPLSYLFAGSAAVIANLWDITDRDIDKFSKAVVNSWLQNEGKVRHVTCSACALIEEPSRGRGTKVHVSGRDSNRRWCKMCATRRIASCISEARDTCKMHMLTGAAPVCYGVPTILRKRHN
ncbi:Separase [Carex littledalei]|uniref:separase n=1 Tax=Carex littledalei TaxID=544730 RepID=A0A833QV80_9POAL|nr:Separase [Carex littledalei]